MRNSKFIHFLLCLVPFVGMVLIQFSVSMVGMFIYGVSTGVRLADQGINDYNTFSQQIMEGANSQIIIMTLIADIIIAVLFGIWYHHGMEQGRLKASLKRIFTPKSAVLIICLAAGIQVFTSMALTLLELLRPEWFTAYNQMLETTGLGNTWYSFLTIVFIAPIAEELVFRGMTFKLTRSFMPFYAANILQAVFFGIIHGNLIQGIYAAIFGLIFGYMYERYHSIFACILLHILVNLAGCAMVFLPESIPVWGQSLLFAAALALSAAALIGIVKITGQKEQKQEAAGQA